jgi:Histone acetyltransferase
MSRRVDDYDGLRVLQGGVRGRSRPERSQHHELCLLMIERDGNITSDAAYVSINMISKIDTREYDRHLVFYDHGFYLQKELKINKSSDSAGVVP